MFKKLLRDSALFTLVSVAEKGVNLVLFPILAHHISVESYGRYDLLLVAVGILVIVGGAELFQGLMRLLPERDSSNAKSLVSTALWSSLFGVGILALLACYQSKVASEIIFFETGLEKYIYWLAAIMILSCGSGVLFTVLRVNYKSKEIAIGSLLRLGVNTAVSLYCVVQTKLGIEGILLGQVCSSIVILLYFIYHSRSYIGFTWCRKEFAVLSGFSYPLIIASLAVVASQQGDRYITSGFLGPAEVGILGTGYRIAGLATLIQGGISMALTPLIYEHYMAKETPYRLERLFSYYSIAYCSLVLFFTIFGNIILVNLLPKEYQYASVLVPIIVASAGVSHAYLFFPGLAIAKKTGIITIHRMCSLVVQFPVVVIAVKFYGLLGMCLASLVMQTLSLLIFITISQKSYAIPIRHREISLFFVLNFVLCAIYSQYLIKTDNVYLMITAYTAIMTISFMVGLVRISEFTAFYSKVKLFVKK